MPDIVRQPSREALRHPPRFGKQQPLPRRPVMRHLARPVRAQQREEQTFAHISDGRRAPPIVSRPAPPSVDRYEHKVALPRRGRYERIELWPIRIEKKRGALESHVVPINHGMPKALFDSAARAIPKRTRNRHRWDWRHHRNRRHFRGERLCDRGNGRHNNRNRLRHGRNLGCSENRVPSRASPVAHDQRITHQRAFDAYVDRRAKSQVDVIPEYGRIASDGCQRARYDRCMRVPFDDVESRAECCIIQRVRKLAKPTAHARHEATLAQFPPGYESPPPRSATNLLPEAKDRPRRHERTVDMPRRDAQILHLAERQRTLRHTGIIRPKRTNGLREQHLPRAMAARRAPMQTLAKIAHRPHAPQHPRFPAEAQRTPNGRNGARLQTRGNQDCKDSAANTPGSSPHYQQRTFMPGFPPHCQHPDHVAGAAYTTMAGRVNERAQDARKRCEDRGAPDRKSGAPCQPSWCAPPPRLRPPKPSEPGTQPAAEPRC
ncbi:MAG: hypothetical protein JWM87_473 [Candidatus Eremiobacteraeota bacterium]|nr:hypothetical protein [Candidatus Eremiobacteraeota bacterium]